MGLEENGLSLGDPILQRSILFVTPDELVGGDQAPQPHMPRGSELEWILTSVIEGPQLWTVTLVVRRFGVLFF